MKPRETRSKNPTWEMFDSIAEQVCLMDRELKRLETQNRYLRTRLLEAVRDKRRKQ